MKASLPRVRAPLLAALVLATTTACENTPPVAPVRPPPPNFARAYAAALEAEAKDSASAEPYLTVLDQAIAYADAPGALPAALASIDALAGTNAPGLEGAGPTAIAYRSRELFPLVVRRLRAAWTAAGARGDRLPFIRGSIASALHTLSLFTGEGEAATLWGGRRGCAQTATIIGPLSSTPLLGIEQPVPMGPDKAMEASYPGIAPFAAQVTPAVVHADQCLLNVNATSFLQGMRVAVIDLIVPHPETVYLSFTSSSAAIVEVGGVRAIQRGFDAGGRATTQLAAARLPGGSVRVVIKLAQRDDGNLIELDAWGEDGLPIRAHAPRTGEAAKGKAAGAETIEIHARDRSVLGGAPVGGPTADEAILTAGALLGLGGARAAEHLLEPGGSFAEIKRPPAIDLLYARSIEAAEDLPDAKMTERIRGAIERVLAGWPTSWEAIVGHARATERRRGVGEGVTEALRELGSGPDGSRVDEDAAPATPNAAGAAPHRGSASGALTPRPRDRLVVAYASLLARRAQLLDIAEDDYTELEKLAPGTPIVAALDARLHPRVGAEAIVATCHGGLSRADTDCLEAYRERGDHASALIEIERLRKLRNAPEALRDIEISILMLTGDLKRALAVYDEMKPAERRLLDAPALAAGRGDFRNARLRFARDRVSARDTPYALDPLLHVLGGEPDTAARLEAEGRRLVLADKDAAYLPGAATAVLRHTERYALEDSGLVHHITYDLRRVSGTTDVAGGGVSYGPMIEGRGAPRLLRRRIHKRDGRILEPDAAANASQASDLSQLEQGDYVEQIVEGWALPGDSGQIVIDTPDLLPERTSVREATIEVRRPASIPFSMWAHPLLGKPEERAEGAFKVSVWHLKDQAPRRIEDGVPKMERSVAVSVGTQTWANVARAMQENIRSLDEHDPYVARWAAEAAAGDRTPSPALIERVVAATGKKVKVATQGELSDAAALFNGGAQHTTARTILELGQGSRAWVVYRALHELGFKVDIAVAETEPFSAAADFPPHAGRFRHALVVATLPPKDGAPASDIWIDADVEGPPLPPGRISPELRGRTALRSSGEMVTVEGTSGETGDEVDIRLAVDDKGDAKGSFSVLLHGRTAQSLADAFETVVGSDRREMLRSVVLGWVPWADVDDVSVSSTEGSWEVALRAAIAVHGFGRPEGKDGKTWVFGGLEPVHNVFPRASVGTLGATYASRGARQNALSIDAPIQYHVHRRIELPAGTTVARSPAGVQVTGKSLSASRKTSANGQVIEEDFTLSLPTGTIAADGYQAFVEKVQAIDAGFMAGTRVNAGARFIPPPAPVRPPPGRGKKL